MNEKTLTKAELVDALHEQSPRSRTEMKGIVESLLKIMKQNIKKDHALMISGFGKFEAYAKDARKGRNPQTAAPLLLSPRKVVVFRLSRKFKEELNK